MVTSKNEKGGKVVLKSNLSKLLLARSMAEGRRITQRELSNATGISEMTISSWMSDEPLDMISSKTVTRLCEYFRCEIGDLIAIETVN